MSSTSMCSKDGSASSSSSSCSEESSWTMYLEDFMASEERKGGCVMSSSYLCMSSTISDAASSIEPRPSANLVSVPKEVIKKKRKGINLLVEDLLEDTASSTATSTPMVSDLSYQVKHPRKRDECRNLSQVEEVASSRNKLEIKKETVDESDYFERAHDCTELGQGIQLVPMSMLLNYN